MPVSDNVCGQDSGQAMFCAINELASVTLILSIQSTVYTFILL